jgi:membrane-associated phospholipid phosphatase
MFRRFACAVIILQLAATAPAAADEDTWNDVGTGVRWALVGAALAAPAVQGDWKGEFQAIGSIGAATLVTTGLKETISKERPDGSDNRSFPSGHTSSSFAAAATLHNRYGWKVGLPAHALAAFVGASRIEAEKHDVVDVLAGAALGSLSGFLITRKRDDGVVIIPWADGDGAGVLIAGRF